MPSQTDPIMLLSVFLLFLIACFTAYYAHQQGRNPILWFIIGILLGIFGLLILIFFPAKSESKNNGTPTMTVSKPDPSQPHGENLLHQEELKTLQNDKLWYYLDLNHQQMGPVSIIALRELWKRGQLELTSYVWSEGMEKWQLVDELPDLKKSLNEV